MKKIIPHLTVNNVNESIDFYTGKLGFEVHFVQKDKNSEPDFAILKKNRIEIMLGYASGNLKKMQGFDKIGASLILYIEMDNPDEFYREIKDNVNIVKPLADTPWGTREFWISDIDNYYFVFFKSL